MAQRQVTAKFPVDLALVALGAAYLPPRSVGYTKVNCPFHEDNTASASIDWDKERFKCFTCSISGDAIDLIMAVREVSFGAAKQFAEDEIGDRRPALPRPARKRASLF